MFWLYQFLMCHELKTVPWPWGHGKHISEGGLLCLTASKMCLYKAYNLYLFSCHDTLKGMEVPVCIWASDIVNPNVELPLMEIQQVQNWSLLPYQLPPGQRLRMCPFSYITYIESQTVPVIQITGGALICTTWGCSPSDSRNDSNCTIFTEPIYNRSR